jgi:hypothetical protein
MNEPSSKPTPSPSRSIASSTEIRFIEQRQRAERYLFGRLTPPETHEFEQQLRKSPGLIDRLGLGDAIKRGLKLLDQQTVMPREAPPTHTPRPWLLPTLAVALSLTLIALGISYKATLDANVRRAWLEGELQRGRVLPPTRTLVMPVSPGPVATDAPIYALGSRLAPTLAELRLDVKNLRATLFRTTIRLGDGTYLARFDNQVKDSDGRLRLALNSGTFPVGAYPVLIESIDLHGDPTPVGYLTLRVD